MKRLSHPLQLTLLAVAGIAVSSAGHAQRTNDNPTAEADDAFGRSVGQESIGIYNPDDVRGFSTIDAGNVRIEGLYFDRQTDPNSRLVEGSSIRVGIAAQGYTFPSPTGISDYDLRRVGDERVISPVLTYGPFNSTGIEVDAKLPLIPEQLGVAAGAGYYHDHSTWGGANRAWTMAVIPRWRPTEHIEVMPFFSHVYYEEEEPQPLMITADGGLPPKIPRERYYGQPWAVNEGITGTYGVVAEARLGQWITRFGAFESYWAPTQDFGELFLDVEDDGRSREVVVAFQDSRFASRSGELRASRSFEAAARRHTLHLALRGRVQQRRYGGEDEIEVGEVQLGEVRSIPQPVYEFGPQSHDEVKQNTVGAAYELQWKQRGELSVGVQKTDYRKSIDTPQGPLPESRADPILLNAAATVYAHERLAIYASYTEGLEESPVAPSNAVNRNAAAPALDTEQYDAGIRWTVTGNMKLIAGIFHIEKPYFDLDASKVFRSLGTVTHQGVEISLAGNPVRQLTLVTGARFLDAEVSGDAVDSGLIGSKPVGKAKRYAIASADYAIEGTGFSVDAIVENISRQTANTANTIEVPGRSVVHVGGRYRFKAFGKPTTVRAQWSNIFDRYGWSVLNGGVYVYNAPRRFYAYVAMDL